MKAKKILVLAYAISPTRGSEYSVAWNYVSNMSQDNELVLLYGMSGAHMGDTDELKQHLKSNPVANVRFIDIRPNKLANLLNSLNRRGILVYTFYLAYNIWHRQAYKKALDIISQEHFDLVHYLGPIGYREPGYLWRINIPYIWGPIGGVPNRPTQLFVAIPFKDKVLFHFRNITNSIQFKINRRLGKAIQRTNALLTATTENQTLIQNYYNKTTFYLPENGIVEFSMPAPFHKMNLASSDVINLVWIGTVDSNKSLNILIKALSKVNAGNWHLHVIGNGSRIIAMQKLAQELNIGTMISWHGQIPRTEVINLLKMAHLNIITSMGEGNPTTIWEAMANGIPTITLDHCGMHDTVCEKCGIKIPIKTLVQVVNDLAFHLDRLLMNPDEINKMSIGVHECAKNYTWAKRRIFFNKMYEMAIDDWNRKIFL